MDKKVVKTEDRNVQLLYYNKILVSQLGLLFTIWI
jgi:hypothetical protein